MKELVMTLTALEPLVITSGSAESMAHECLGHVPGSMLLGAMASIWKRRNRGACADDNAEFRSLFLNGEISWGHALPMCGHVPAVPVPLAYRRVKNHGSLPPEDATDIAGKYYVLNYLYIDDDDAARKLWQSDNPGVNGDDQKIKKMPVAFMNPDTLRLAPEERVWNIHVALGQKRSALEGQLFGYSALAPGTRLQSRMVCHTQQAASALEKLAANISQLWVGHARSAGYGRARIDLDWREASAPPVATKKEYNLFCISQYLPQPSWENPLTSLRKEISAIAGEMPDIAATCAGLDEISGYNSFWNRPRTTRTGLAMGSALRLVFKNPVSLPAEFALGAARAEGYGRMVCDPSFLAGPVPKIPLLPGRATVQKPASVKIPRQNAPIWNLLRQRAVSRLLVDQANAWLHHEKWRKFLGDAASAKITASQRNNLRSVDLSAFAAMLDKTPGAQWKQAICFSPFNGRKDHLSEIMLNLLNPDMFIAAFPVSVNLAQLPGAPASQEEKSGFGRDAHRLFVRQLISVWGKMAPGKKNTRDENDEEE